MSYIDVKGMDREPFGQIAEQVFFDRVDPPYSDAVNAAVMERLHQEVLIAPVVGRTSIFKLIHDGEVGPSLGAIPRMREPQDPLTQGV